MTTWHKGPPPSLGWWPAAFHRNKKILRWWDGISWSIPVMRHMSASQAAENAARKEPDQYQNDIEWTERPASWPERSRT
jgi:hypothetical protein